MGNPFSKRSDEEGDRGADDGLEKLARHIAKSRQVSFFTGAGISVDSGIPDFRSPGGLWETFDPFRYCDYDVFLESPHLFWSEPGPSVSKGSGHWSRINRPSTAQLLSFTRCSAG